MLEKSGTRPTVPGLGLSPISPSLERICKTPVAVHVASVDFGLTDMDIGNETSFRSADSTRLSKQHDLKTSIAAASSVLRRQIVLKYRDVSLIASRLADGKGSMHLVL